MWALGGGPVEPAGAVLSSEKGWSSCVLGISSVYPEGVAVTGAGRSEIPRAGVGVRERRVAGATGTGSTPEKIGSSAARASSASAKRAAVSRFTHWRNQSSKPSGRRSATPYSAARSEAGAMGSMSSSHICEMTDGFSECAVFQ